MNTMTGPGEQVGVLKGEILAFVNPGLSPPSYVYLRPRRSVTAPAACSSAPPGSGTAGPAGTLSRSGGRRRRGLWGARTAA